MISTVGFALPKPQDKPRSKVRTYGWKEFDDPTSPDGKRYVAYEWHAYHWVRRVLCRIAGERCEQCRRPTPLEYGDADHERLRKLGGGCRDDRIFIWNLKTGELIRQLWWKCRPCHRRKHNQ